MLMRLGLGLLILVCVVLPGSVAAEQECDDAYNQQFVNWMGFLTAGPSLGQPARPDPTDPCYATLLQAQSDAFTAWSASPQQTTLNAPERPADGPAGL